MYHMNDTSASSKQGATGARRWLLLIHQLPPKPDYLRVKVRRRLKGIGAVPVKQTVYLLPNTDESLEDFQWLRQEIESAGASALIIEATFVEGISDEELDAMVQAEQEDTVEHDANSERKVESVLPGRTWVTRNGVFVDRIASAWLIRRFIDPEARFKFVEARGRAPIPDELRFDMVGADYTHVGEDCTFQTLRKQFGLADAALVAIGEVVHDIDCKDELFGHPETAGVAGMLRGITEATESDDERLARGFLLFDNLHAFYGSRRA
jgi:hypothetical protein